MSTGAQSPSSAPALANRRWPVWLLYGGVIVFVAFLLLYRLPYYSTAGFDEGAFFNVARTFAREGVYAEASQAGYRYTGPVASTGPTVILPVALVYRLFGVGIPQGRAVVVAYGALALIALYGLAALVTDWRGALLAVILAVVGIDLLMPALLRGEHTGEGPGLFFLLAGLWFWLRPGERRWYTLLGVGVLMGLSSITKYQNAVFVLPALLLAWIVDLVWYRRRGWRYFVVPGIVAGVIFFAWMYYILFLLGGADRAVASDAQGVQAATLTGYLVIDFETNLANFRTLATGQAISVAFLPALLYGLILALRRDDEGQRWGILWLFLMGSASMFILSLGWSRNATVVSFLSVIFAVRLVYDLTGGLHFDWAAIRSEILGSGRFSLSTIIAVVTFSLAFSVVVIPTFQAVLRVMLNGDDSYYRLGDFIRENAPADAVIETFDKEVSLLSDNPYHFPTDHVETLLNQGITVTSDDYHFEDYVDPLYVIVGPYGKNVYHHDSLTGYEEIDQIGPYRIYRRSG